MRRGVITFSSRTIGASIPAGAITYLYPSGHNDAPYQIRFPFPVKFSQLMVECSSPPGADQSNVYTLIKDAAETPLSATMAHQNVLAIDGEHEVTFLAGTGPVIRLLTSTQAQTGFHQGSLQWQEVEGSTYRPIVFVGDSITWAWTYPASLKAFNRGVAGRTTPQMEIGFADEVLSMNPGTVVLLGGSNDLRLVTSPNVDSIYAMAIAARNYGARVLLAKIPPISAFSPYAPTNMSVQDFNAALVSMAEENGFEYVDYFTPMINADGTLDGTYFVGDGLHPNAAGYSLMSDVLAAHL